MTVNVAPAVPELPSVTVTSSIEIAGAVVVGDRAEAWPSAIVALTGSARFDAEGLVGLVEQVAVDLTLTDCVVSPGSKSSVPLVGRVVARRGRRAVGRRVLDADRLGARQRERVTVKVALTGPSCLR